MNYFAELRKIDVSEHIEKKGQFNYLSWAWAVDILGLHHPKLHGKCMSTMVRLT